MMMVIWSIELDHWLTNDDFENGSIYSTDLIVIMIIIILSIIIIIIHFTMS